MFERFTDSARGVIVGAAEEARTLGHNAIGTEHLLLAILHSEDTIAAGALASLGVSPTAVREQVGRGTGTTNGHIPLTPRGKKALELALREALQLGHAHIGPEHLLLGIVREGGGRAVRVLEELGVQSADLRNRVVQLLEQHGDGAQGDERVEVSVSRESHVTMGMQAGTASGDEPRCPRCNSDAVANLRARTLPLADGATTTRVTLVWCEVCGAVIGVVPAADS